MLLTQVGRGTRLDVYHLMVHTSPRVLEGFLTYVLVHILFQRSLRGPEIEFEVPDLWSKDIDPSRIDEKDHFLYNADHNSSYRLG
jgi:hypothetical protein